MKLYELFATGGFVDKFVQTFITKDRWKMFAEGFGATIFIAFCAAILGITFGVLFAVAMVYCYHSGKLKILDRFLDVYLTVIRGTPSLVQLLIMYYIIFTSIDNGIIVAILSFGINSGAYVAEIVRGGILAVDKGQTEAGRSLGLSTWTTMQTIILPQAVKNILPALGNEFITLLKETSIVGYIAISDLTKAAVSIQTLTYEPMFPLFSVAAIYLVLVMGMTALQRKLEKKKKKSDRR